MSIVNTLSFRFLGAFSVLTFFLVSAPYGFASGNGSQDFCVFSGSEGFYLTSDVQINDDGEVTRVVFDLLRQDDLLCQELIEDLSERHLVADSLVPSHLPMTSVDTPIAIEFISSLSFTFSIPGDPNPGEMWIVVDRVNDDVATLVVRSLALVSVELESLMQEDVGVFDGFSFTHVKHSGLPTLSRQLNFISFADDDRDDRLSSKSSPFHLSARIF